MTQTYMSLIAGGVSTRRAAVLTAMVRSTATRRRNAATAPTPAVSMQPADDPVNKLTDAERRRVLEVLTSDRFVDSRAVADLCPTARRRRLPVFGVHDVPGVGREHAGR